MTEPTIGRVIHYTLSEADAAQIMKRRADFDKHRLSDDYADTGYVAHFGNRVVAGQVCPAVIVAVWPGSTTVNLHVLLDGVDAFWATSRAEGDRPGTWAWPARA